MNTLCFSTHCFTLVLCYNRPLVQMKSFSVKWVLFLLSALSAVRFQDTVICFWVIHYLRKPLLPIIKTLTSSCKRTILFVSVCSSRATAILAYLPQELLGTSFYEYFHQDDISHLAECHRQGAFWETSRILVRVNREDVNEWMRVLTANVSQMSTVLQMREKINTNCYKFKIKDGSFITLRSRWFSFMNPWTKEVEYIVSTNTVVS